MSTCKVEGCNDPFNAKGFCRKHYEKFKRYGDPLYKRETQKGQSCTVPGCGNGIICKGLCAIHYGRWRRNGDPLKTALDRDQDTGRFFSKSDTCKAAGCNGHRFAKGYCQNHYYHFWKHGSATGGRSTPNRKRGAGTKNNGYHFTSVLVSGVQRQIGTHRLVMERKLRRKLRKNENVHHVNGIRDDNRSENLELWVKTQPCGQRPEDLVSWASEILKLYAAEVRAGKRVQ